MKFRLYLLAGLMLLSFGSLKAQTLLKGTIYEENSSTKVPNVFVRDNNNKQITISDDNGKFEINTETGHILIFSAPNYIADTLYVVDMSQKKIQLKTKTIALHQVDITASKEAFDPHKEYPEVYEKSKVYPLSPSTWFSKEGKDARRLKRFFRSEEEDRKVDEAFNMYYVGSLVPLKGQDLEDFMTLYRPTYKFVTGNDRESMAVYINDSYKKFMALPPDKRKLQRLTSQ